MSKKKYIWWHFRGIPSMLSYGFVVMDFCPWWTFYPLKISYSPFSQALYLLSAFFCENIYCPSWMNGPTRRSVPWLIWSVLPRPKTVLGMTNRVVEVIAWKSFQCVNGIIFLYWGTKTGNKLYAHISYFLIIAKNLV